ncbi:MAG: hypothetical protein JEZ11_06615 [Desulfobacterales bacterium]|nr:hypothetical protein [Desulfobacterales bacterium]
MVIVIGEILIDRFPDYQRIGGAPFNFAFHLKQAGVPVRLISRIGEDPDGERIRRSIVDSGFDANDLQVDPLYSTGAVEVTLDADGGATFDILTDVAYDHLRLDHLPESLPWAETDMIYFGSLVQRTAFAGGQLKALLERRGPRTRCFCDINLRPPHYTRAVIESSLAYADILKLSDGECREIGRMAGGPDSPVDCARWLMGRYGIELVAITAGAGGSCIVTAGEVVEAPALPDITVVDTVGAGDGYGAILALGLLRGAALKDIAVTAADFAARICGLAGAVPEDRQFYAQQRLF